jgi:D-alanyl-D-alanine carboxypeptidase
MTPQRMLQWIVACVLVVSFIDTVPAEAGSRRTRKARTAPAKSAWLESRSAIVLDARTGRALFERKPDTQMYPASTTKVLTAIVAIEKGDLDDMVTIQPSDVKVQPSSIGLKVGEKISLRDLVYGLLLRSGNDAAMAIARHVGNGNRSRFYDMMNERARKLGCTSTHFANPHGLPDRTHYTTARDLGHIMVYAMKNDTFRTVTSTSRYVSTSSQRTRVMHNKNRLLSLYPGTTGGKPGYTRAAQQTLVAAAKRADRELVVVCLHSVGRALWSDATHLFDFGFSRLGVASNGADPQSSALASLSAP